MTEANMQRPPNKKKSLREREAELDARSSGLDTRTDINAIEAFDIVRRAGTYIALFPWRYLTKFVLKLGAYAIALFALPWPGKILVDHVILATPIEEATGYPGYAMPIIELMHGMSPLEILIWVAVTGIATVLLIGAYTQDYRDDVEAGLLQGRDYATQVENQMHGGHSTFGGLWGLMEFKLNTRLTQSLNHTLRSQLFERIMSLSITRLEEQRIGDSIYRVMYDTPQINEIFYEITHTPIMATVLYIQALGILYSAYPHLPELMWITLGMFPAWALCASVFSRFVRRRGQAARAAGAITTSTIEEGMDNMLAVQSLGGQDEEKDRFGDDSDESFTRYRAVTLLWILIGNLGGVFTTVVGIAFMVFISGKIIEGELSVGDYIALGLIFGYLQGPAMALGWLWIRFQDNVTAMRRVFAMMDIDPEDDLGVTALQSIEQGIQIEGAGLVYPDGRRALDDISIEANVGQIVAFVGPTGSGKTSLAYLIPRYHVATEGSISVDGTNVNDLTLESLRDQVTYVFQETQLFSLSIHDNISYGRPDASRDDVERVARIAGVHDFISSLPDGYDTKLGTATASKLSVGQKQRISIARGLLRDSKILILDEPTSALDPETEEYLVQSLHEAAKNRLVIIIAHRLSTIAHADKIIFLEEGKVVEQGSHVELMGREGGHYRRFVELQTEAA